MSTLDTLNFQPILLVELFSLHPGRGAKKRETGPVPYIAASFRNNGIVGYVEQPMYPGGWLSLVKDGDGGAGKCFYQPGPFWPSNHVYGLQPMDRAATEPALLLLAATITHQCFPKYNRGFAANEQRLSRQRIMVPVITDAYGTVRPDWRGMDLLGRELLDTVRARVKYAMEPLHESRSNPVPTTHDAPPPASSSFSP